MKKSKCPNIESTTSLINESILFGLIDAQSSKNVFLRISMGPIFQRMRAHGEKIAETMNLMKWRWKKIHYVNKSSQPSE